MSKTPSPKIPEFTEPEMFTDIAGKLVISEAAAPDEAAFVHGALDAIRADLPARKMTLQDDMDELRRARVAQERADYLATQQTDSAGEENTPETTSYNSPASLALQGTLQLEIPGVESKKPARKKVAFGRYLKRAIHDVAGERNPSLITKIERDTMRPENIAPLVYRNSRKRQGQEGYYVDDILLNQVEYRMIPRSPKHIATSAHARTLGETDLREDDDVLARADRSVSHVFEIMKPKLEEHLASLVSSYTDLDRLSKLVKTPGYAHETPEELERLISVAWNEFNNLVHIIGVQQNWNQEQLFVAETSLVASFTEGAQNKRVKAFGDQLRFAKRYLRSRVNLYENRLGKTESYLPEPEQETERETLLQ